MILKSRFALLVSAVVLACPPAVAVAQPAAQQERVAASFVLALGRTPTSGELEQWAKQEPLPLADLVARHRGQLQSDPAAQQAVIAKASQDAFGRAPGEDGVTGVPGGGPYAEVVQRHLRWLAEHPDVYERVMNRAYRLVLRRDAYSIEADYWKRQPALSFALLAGCIDDWARRNQPGLMATAGSASVSVNSAYLVTVRLSPAVAAEARAASGMAPSRLAPRDSALGRTIVAPGAEQVASVGGIFFAAAGSARLASASGRE